MKSSRTTVRTHSSISHLCILTSLRSQRECTSIIHSWKWMRFLSWPAQRVGASTQGPPTDSLTEGLVLHVELVVEPQLKELARARA